MYRTLLTTVLLFCGTLTAGAGHWPAWRGPNGNGHCPERDLPTEWSATQNVRWKAQLPAAGNSSPIVWGDRVFLTQALDVDMRQQIARRRAVLCFDRKDGKLLWQREVEYPQREPTHSTNPYCSSSPVTDGERVIAWQGSAGMVCYDFNGQLLWKRDLGKVEHIWGYASSPVLYRDLVLLNFGPGERTFLVALDKKTGTEVWRVEEPGGKSGSAGQSEWLGSWSTPSIVRVGGRDECIVTWPEIVKAFDPATGKLLWTCRGLGKLVYTSPVVTPEVVVALSGYGGPALAVRPGGSGDVTDTHRLWHQSRGAPQRIGSGILLGEHFFQVNEPSTLQCLEWRTGKPLWTERLGAKCWGSLVLADDKLYVTTSDGETVVLAAKPTFQVLHRNPLNEHSEASPAIADGQIVIRTYGHLWCIDRNP